MRNAYSYFVHPELGEFQYYLPTRVMMILVDFHMHTTISDGIWTPQELFRHVREAQIRVASVTDHDTMDIYPIPSDLCGRIVTGMEVDTKCEGVTAHLLVYGITSQQAPLLEHLRSQRAARRVRMEEMVERLHGLGVDIAMRDVEAQAGSAASLGRPHLARALVVRGVVNDVKEAFTRYLADDQDGYVALDRLDARDAIALAHESGALVSIAHPCRLRDPRLIDTLRMQGADGIEVIHPSADASARAELAQYANHHGLVITGGSDFHSPATDALPGIWFEETLLERFLAAVDRVSGGGFDPTRDAERTGATA
jgi:3',5'-nucleoside bisphosphate phosphatase